MFVADKSTIEAVRRAYEESGELAAVLESRWHSPGITNDADAGSCVRTMAGWKPFSLQSPTLWMPDLTDDKTTLPPHIEDTVQTIAAVHQQHYQQAAPLQQVVGHMVAVVGRPVFVVILTIFILGWIVANLAILWIGRVPWDAPPFPWLACAASVVALYTTVLILVTQRHDDELARHREQLTLEIAILSEQKSAKIIQLLERMRHDSPHLAAHADREAEVMSDSADPQFILNALKDAHRSSG